MNYVVGLYFTGKREHADSLLLVTKQQPSWMCGCLNGVGGKIEINETPRKAMRREFEEETHGIEVLESEWEDLAIVSHAGSVIHFFSHFSGNANSQMMLQQHIADNGNHNDAGEPLKFYTIAAAMRHPELMRNLRPLIQLALDEDFVKPLQMIDRSPVPPVRR